MDLSRHSFGAVVPPVTAGDLRPFVDDPAVRKVELEAMNVIAFVIEVGQQFKSVLKVLAHSSYWVNSLFALSKTPVDLIVNFVLNDSQMPQMLKHP